MTQQTPTNKSISIEDFADIINKELDIKRYPNQDNRYMVKFDAEVKDDCVLIGYHGNGSTPTEAIQDYIKKIKGRTLVFNAMTKDRKEFVVPTTLEY